MPKVKAKPGVKRPGQINVPIDPDHAEMLAAICQASSPDEIGEKQGKIRSYPVAYPQAI